MKRTTRKRTLLMVLLLLTGGTIINVAVAWGLYLWRPFQGHPFRPTTMKEAQHVWDRAWPPGTPFVDDRNLRRYQLHGLFTATPAYRIIFIWLELPQPGQTQWRNGSAWEFQAGWPARSIVAHRWGFDRSNHGLMVIKDTWIPIGKKDGSPIMDDFLPYRPYWPGFAINTIFYAAILWLLFAAPGFARRRIRARRGQCPACAYPIGTSNVCTECGKAVRPKA